MLKTENINNNFFNGFYKDIWRQMFPEKTTLAETDFIIEEGKLIPGNRVLDIMCGHGRHSLELARRGIKVTAVDNLLDYTNEINKKAAVEKLEIECICNDVLDLQINKQYDAVICMGNSLQFFNDKDLLMLLSKISSHLRTGGKLFVNSWSLAEIVLKNFKEKSWSRINEILFLSESKFLLRPARLESNCIIIKDNGEREEKTGVDYIYTLSEMEKMFDKTGFILKETYSIPGKKLFSPGEPRAYLVAEKK